MRITPLLTILLLALADDTAAKPRRVKRGSCKTPQQPLMASSSNSNSNLGSTSQQKPGAGLQSLGSINLGGGSAANQISHGSGSGGIASGSSSGQGSGGQSNGGSAGSIYKAPGIWRNSTDSTQSIQQISTGVSGGGASGGGSDGGNTNSNSNGGTAGTSGGSSGAAAAAAAAVGGGADAGGASATTESTSANTTATAIGAVMSSSFTQYGAGDSFGSPSCNTATAACGWYSNPGFNAAVSENLFGVGPGGGAGETCGKCYKLTATSDQAGKPLSGGAGSIVVKVNNLCPKAGNPLCSQNGMGGTNQYGANVNFDICKDDGAAGEFFGGSSGMALGTAVEVDCGGWGGSGNLSS